MSAAYRPEFLEDIATTHNRAVTGRWDSIEPRGDDNHPHSPNHRSNELAVERIADEIFADDLALANVIADDAEAFALDQQLTLTLARGLPVRERQAQEFFWAAQRAVEREAQRRADSE